MKTNREQTAARQAEKINKIAVIGGDSRQIHLAQYLQNSGKDVSCFALLGTANHGLKSPYSLAECLRGCSHLVLPIPVSRDECYLSTPLWEIPLPLDELVEKISPETKVYGGLFSIEFAEVLRMSGHTVYDYANDAILLEENAQATAEAALALIIMHSQSLLRSSNVVILGSGRISRYLAQLVTNVGAQVTLLSRSIPPWVDEIHAYMPLHEAEYALAHADMVVNTIPAQTIDQTAQAQLCKGTLFIDLASGGSMEQFPCGLRPADAARNGVIAMHSLGLPGKFSPRFAGELIAKYVLKQESIY